MQGRQVSGAITATNNPRHNKFCWSYFFCIPTMYFSEKSLPNSQNIPKRVTKKLNSNYIFKDDTRKVSIPFGSAMQKKLQPHKRNQTQYLTVHTLPLESPLLECPFSARLTSGQTFTLLFKVMVIFKGNRKYQNKILHLHIYIYITRPTSYISTDNTTSYTYTFTYLVESIFQNCTFV